MNRERIRERMIMGGLFAFAFWLVYFSVSAWVFQWRNPKANQIQVFRNLGAVLTFQKLDEFQ